MTTTVELEGIANEVLNSVLCQTCFRLNEVGQPDHSSFVAAVEEAARNQWSVTDPLIVGEIVGLCAAKLLAT
ncbi:MAG: hypothetical protein AAGF24_05340 [Cyanobacteria bacterium P01_H01_bin.121]